MCYGLTASVYISHAFYRPFFSSWAAVQIPEKIQFINHCKMFFTRSTAIHCLTHKIDALHLIIGIIIKSAVLCFSFRLFSNFQSPFWFIHTENLHKSEMLSKNSEKMNAGWPALAEPSQREPRLIEPLLPKWLAKTWFHLLNYVSVSTAVNKGPFLLLFLLLILLVIRFLCVSSSING